MKRSLYRIAPVLREELKGIVTKELEKHGIFSKYRLETTWSHILYESKDSIDEGVDIYRFVYDESKKFIYEAWGPNGRINRLFE